MLAICFACDKFYQYIYGKHVLIESDHRPLESIMKKPIAKAPPRLQRMMLRLQRYDLMVKYIPGKYMYLADTLSRAVLAGKPDVEMLDDMEVMVHSLVECLPVSSTKLVDIKKATQDDQSLQLLKATIKNGWPKSKKSVPRIISEYWNIRDQIHEIDDLLFFGDRIIVPQELRRNMLELLHESHLGMAKTKSRARTVIFWPGISRDIEDRSTQSPSAMCVCVTEAPTRKNPCRLMRYLACHGRNWLQTS